MLKVLIINMLLLSLSKELPYAGVQTNAQDKKSISEVDSLNKKAYEDRLSDPKSTVKTATEAFTIAKNIGYLKGKAEACRVTGIGQYYLSHYEKALDKYLEAISYFEQSNNLKGTGKVYNNIGNLYLLNDYDKALEYYNKSLLVAKKFDAIPEIAGLYGNIGIVQMKRKNFNAAVEKFQLSMKLARQLNNEELIVQCLQNLGEAYNSLKQYTKAEELLKEAFTKAKAKNMDYTIAGIELTLTNVYINQNKFYLAKEALKTGFEYTKDLNNRDLQNDYNYALYQLEYKMKNYQAALNYLKKNFSQDSAYYRQSFSKKITLAADLFNQLENRRKNERTIAQQKYLAALFTASTVVVALMAALIFLMVINIKRTSKSNQKLKSLNAEVFKQKEDLDRINNHLEDMIEVSTKDLIIKNKKLLDYSLHLSHQVRGPIATLKGIVYIHENDLIDREECISLIKKCVFNIDDEIISMSKTLNENPDLNKT